MSTETITFQNFNMLEASPGDIYRIGQTPERDGVIPEIAKAFSHTLTEVPDADNLEGLRKKVGQSKELQKNIEDVRAQLRTTGNAEEIAGDWVERSGVLLPVTRSYMNPAYQLDPHQEGLRMFFMSDGMRNWMQRRCDVLIDQFAPFTESDQAIIGSGIRPMSGAEGPDVINGMTAATYMEDFIAPRLADVGLRTELVTTPSEEGDKVMDAIAYRAMHHLDNDDRYTEETPQMILVSNAGAWPQNGGQLRRAFGRAIYPYTDFEFDKFGEDFFVATDVFPLGTGVEPKTTHQHPLSALGMIVRGAQEAVRHIA